MIRLAAIALTFLVGSSQDSAPTSELASMQVMVQQQIIIRVPRGRDAREPAKSVPMGWRETAGPRCVLAQQVAGAMPRGARVDLLLRDKRRVRAKLTQRCVGLGHYDSLYLSAGRDGLVCANRDTMRTRMGGQCQISQFQWLQPVRR